MNYRNFISKLLIVATVTIASISCKRDRTELRLVFPNKVNYESFIVAKEQQFFNSLENEITIQTVNSGINAAEVFNTGNADIIATGNGPAVILLSQNENAVIVTRYATGETMHRLIADTSIQKIQSLKGKRIGIQVGSSTHASLLAWFTKNNISVDEIELVPMQPANMPEAMKNKQLDAIAGSEPWALNVEKLCGSSVYELSNLYDSLNCQSHVLITKRETYQTHKSQINIILDGLNKANNLINSNPEKSAEIVSKQIGLTAEQQQICTSRLKWETGWEQKDIQSLQETAKTLYDLKKIKTIPEIEDYLIKK